MVAHDDADKPSFTIFDPDGDTVPIVVPQLDALCCDRRYVQFMYNIRNDCVQEMRKSPPDAMSRINFYNGGLRAALRCGDARSLSELDRIAAASRTMTIEDAYHDILGDGPGKIAGIKRQLRLPAYDFLSTEMLCWYVEGWRAHAERIRDVAHRFFEKH